MNFITEQDFNETARTAPYYQDRWGYFNAVIEMAKKVNPKSILEIGVFKLPVCRDSDTMDIKSDSDRLTFLQDAKQTPYNVKDKRYDLLIAMQTLEHMHPEQKKVFAEWKRIAKVVIISLPYLWECPLDEMHHQITMEKIKEWTGTEPSEKQFIGSRIVLKYNFKDYA